MYRAQTSLRRDKRGTTVGHVAAQGATSSIFGRATLLHSEGFQFDPGVVHHKFYEGIIKWTNHLVLISLIHE